MFNITETNFARSLVIDDMWIFVKEAQGHGVTML